jgi:hypothetical protein
MYMLITQHICWTANICDSPYEAHICGTTYKSHICAARCIYAAYMLIYAAYMLLKSIYVCVIDDTYMRNIQKNETFFISIIQEAYMYNELICSIHFCHIIYLCCRCKVKSSWKVVNYYGSSYKVVGNYFVKKVVN